MGNCVIVESDAPQAEVIPRSMLEGSPALLEQARPSEEVAVSSQLKQCSSAEDIEMQMVMETDTVVPGDTASEDLTPSADEARTISIEGFGESDSEVMPMTSSASNRPDFSGTWICTRVEGDWEAFLRLRGTSWAGRKLAASVGFGVGTQTQSIKQDGDEVEVVNRISSGYSCKEERSTLRADGSEQDTVDPEGRPLRQRTTWDGDALVSEQASLILRRFFQGSEMCTERKTSTGLVVKRFYRRLPCS
eukprot:TRINITY_DN12479_c0_g1_i1.p1 TRINITY_DN12479_c0_g1~~TRINITY_DN12479_c0_g1_i1.p1  ORF type:complete len:248 (-),score=48.39 TRINITY_DN12479_c0_g1_i1:196-939(-)